MATVPPLGRGRPPWAERSPGSVGTGLVLQNNGGG